MKKMPTVFVRDFSTRPYVITPEVTPGCEWVLQGEGKATRKWDGTCVLFRDRKLYARYDCKKGRTPPPGFQPCEPEPDAVTGHWPGWVEVTDQPQYKWHIHAWMDLDMARLYDGTYELVGPKVNGNPEKEALLQFIPHGYAELDVPVRTQAALEAFLTENEIEGIVFHHPDGRMAKIKRKDFGLQWPVKGD